MCMRGGSCFLLGKMKSAGIKVTAASKGDVCGESESMFPLLCL